MPSQQNDPYHTQDTLQSFGGVLTTDRERRNLGVAGDLPDHIIANTVANHKAEQARRAISGGKSLGPPPPRSRCEVPTEAATATLEDAPVRPLGPKAMPVMPGAVRAWTIFAAFAVLTMLFAAVLVTHWGARQPYWPEFSLRVSHEDTQIRQADRKAVREFNRRYFDSLFAGQPFYTSCSKSDCLVPEPAVLSKILAMGEEKMAEVCRAFARYKEEKAQIQDRASMPELERIKWRIGWHAETGTTCELSNRKELAAEDVKNLIPRRGVVIVSAVLLILIAALLAALAAKRSRRTLPDANAQA